MRQRIGHVLAGIVLGVALAAVPLHAQGPFTAQIEAFWRLISTGGRSFSTLSLTTGGYENFGAILGVNGYGIRDNGGTIQFKNSGGVWAAFSGTSSNPCPGDGTTYIAQVATNDLGIFTNATNCGSGTQRFDVSATAVTGAVAFVAPSGSQGAPGYAFTAGNGFFFNTVPVATVNSVARVSLASFVGTRSDGGYSISSTTDPQGAADVFLRRSAAKTIALDADGAGGALTLVDVRGPLTASGSITSGSNLLATAGGLVGDTGRGGFLMASDGIVQWLNNTQTTGFDVDGTTDGTAWFKTRGAADTAIIKAATVNATTAYQFNGNAFAAATIGPSAPTGTTSTTLVMAGLGGSITTRTGRISLCMSGVLADSVANDGTKVQISYGTGTAPTNGAALTGTQIGPVQQFNAANVAAETAPYGACTVVTGLSSGTAYWFDVAFAAITGGTASLTQAYMSANDVP